jgi:hypothetical protein
MGNFDVHLIEKSVKFSFDTMKAKFNEPDVDDDRERIPHAFHARFKFL